MDPADVLTIALAVGVPALLIFTVLRYRRLWRTSRRELAEAQSAKIQDRTAAELMNAVDAIAIEVERVSEHQRFLTKVLAERDAEPTAAPARRPGGEDTER